MLVAVVAYEAALPLLAVRLGRRDWLSWWALLVPVSVFQVLPDWALVTVARTLRFPDVGGPRVGGAIGLVMAGMWVCPLFLALVLGGGPRHPGRVAVAALGVLGGSELVAPALRLWEPVGTVTRVAGVALYVLPAEAVLGLAVALALRWAAGRRWWEQAGAALAVSTLYTGALVLALLLLDAGALTLTAR